MDDKNWWEMKALVDKRKAENTSRYKDQSKKRLIKNVGGKIRTTMIGALSIFEKYFGDLWGLDNDGPLTPEQKRLKSLWEKTRSEILDKGNHNLRTAEEEIAMYDCEWKRYNTDFIIKDHNITQDK